MQGSRIYPLADTAGTGAWYTHAHTQRHTSLSPRVPQVATVCPVLLGLLAAPGDVVWVAVDGAVHQPVGSGEHAQVVVEVEGRTVEEHEQAAL